MFNRFRWNKRTSTESVDIIEKIVYEYLKPLGFRKYGRTIHRFVDGDISQVVHFQNGCPAKGVHNILWVNLGIRVPECVERTFTITEPLKKYYHEYECNIRTRLGALVDGKDSFYDLRKDPQKIARDIVNRIEKYVLPIFEALNSRDAILKRRTEFTRFDQFNKHMILLENAMVFGRRGDLKEATRLFNAHYQKALADYNNKLEYGDKTYLKKGERIVYHNGKTDKTEIITASKSGYVTIYHANKGHLIYLDDLARKLGVSIYAL
ncbi:MAG: DUF4304 domain-containing protein [Clostridia bacterium]|nr:DUF4304 domain-containing protein [Clostridia bacterium]